MKEHFVKYVSNLQNDCKPAFDNNWPNILNHLDIEWDYTALIASVDLAEVPTVCPPRIQGFKFLNGHIKLNVKIQKNVLTG